MTDLVHLYVPGQRVTVGDGAIRGIVERVIFARDMSVPLYLVEWWHEGQLQAREFSERDLSGA